MSSLFEGEIYSWTVVERESAPANFVWCAPYVLLLVRLFDGPMVTTMMTDVVQDKETGELVCPEIGQRVELVVRRMSDPEEGQGIIEYNYSARVPIPTASDEQVEAIREEIRAWMR